MKDKTDFKKGANELGAVAASEKSNDRAVPESKGMKMESKMGSYGSKGIQAHMGQAVSHLKSEYDCTK